jgi:hypothetical protein
MLPTLPLFDPDTERPPFGAAELYLETPASVGVLYLAGILEDQREYVVAIDTAWAEAREAALRCLRENVMFKVGYHARLPSVWVSETPLTSCGLLIFMEEAAEPVVAADAGEVGLAVFRERT